MMPSEISRDTFVAADSNTRLLLIFDLLDGHIKKQDSSCEKRAGECDNRFLKIERRKKIDTAVAASGGFIGGFLAIIIKAKFWE